MPALTLSDLSQMFQLRRDTVRVRQGLATATQELSSGKKADLGRSVSGNYAPLVALDQQLSALAGYETNAKEAALFADMAQAALEQVKQATGDLGARLIGVKESDITTIGKVVARESEGAFHLAVSALNSTVAGRSVFGGTATDRAPLATGADMLAEIRAAVAAAGATTAEDVKAAVDGWFHTPGGGFETTGYQGSAEQISNFKVSEGRSIAMPIKADDVEIRNQLSGLALAAMLEGSGISDSGEQVRLAHLAGEAIIANQDRMLSLQALVGSAQARIETAATQNGSEKTALQMARSGIVSIDPYEVATALQNLEVQLQTIYTITARLSGLSLTNYLR
jgi:flagellar hook-associated protein 3 FlgL